MAAGDSVIGALRVVLGTDTAQFEDGLKSAGDSLGEFAKKAAEIATGIQLSHIVDKLTESFVDLIKTSIEGADQLGKMSQRIGVPIEALSEFTAAAHLSDLSLQELGQSMSRLARSMTQAASGGVGPAASAFQYLGITTKELKSLGPDEVLNKLADAFQHMPDGANKTALAIAVFGRAGAQMIPVLNQGSEGLKKQSEEFRKLGLIISAETSEQAIKFVESAKLLGSSFQGVANIVAAYFLPSMAKSAESLLHWVTESGAVQTAADGIIRSFKFMADNAVVFGTAAAIAFGPAAIEAIVSMAAAAARLALSLVIAAAANILLAGKWALIVGGATAAGAAIAYATDTLGVFEKVWTSLKETFEKTEIWKSVVGLMEAMGLKTKALTETLHPLANAALNAAGAAGEMGKVIGKVFDPEASNKAAALTNELSKLKLQTRETGGEFSTLGPNFVQAAIAAKLFKNDAEAANFTLDKMTPTLQRINVATLGLFAAQKWKENLTPMQEYELQMDTINAALEKFPERQKELGDSAARAAAKMKAAYADAGAALIGGFASIFQAIGTKNKSAFQAWKAFATAEAIIATYAAAQKAFASAPPPLSYVLMAAAIATGIANVIKIQQTQFTGAATGGQFMVPGGSMGVDTKMVSMALAPGELVKVTPAGEANRGGVQEIQMKGIRPGDLFTGDMVRGMFDALNRGYGDGYRVKFGT